MTSRVERIRVGERRVPELLASNIQSALILALRERGTASLCLAGGQTPRLGYEALAQAPGIDWSGVSVYFGDERCVPPDHPESNYLLARLALLDRVGILPESVHRIRAESRDSEAAAADYSQELPDQFDVLVLGVGEDGHTASLFPNSPAVRETERRVLPVLGPKPPFERITLTPPALRGRLVLVVAVGAAKSDAVFQALEGDLDSDRCPAQLARDAVWILDHAAGKRLTGSWV